MNVKCKRSEYRRSKEQANTQLARVLLRLFPHAWLSSRYDPMFVDGLSVDYIRANLHLRKRFKGFESSVVKKVGIIALPRSGSHLFATQFHYLPGCFCFEEGFSRVDAAALNWRTFLLRSTFGCNGLQGKDPAALTHLVYNHNSAVADPWPTVEDRQTMAVYYFRNPLRILVSMDRTKKTKWQLNLKQAQWMANLAADRICAYQHDAASGAKHTLAIAHEQFIRTPKQIFKHVCARLHIEGGNLQSIEQRQQFFQRFFRCGSQPVLRDGFLVSPVTGEKIVGWGGNFNPIASIQEDRNYTAPLEKIFTQALLEPFVRRFGKDLIELWMTDHQHRYIDIDVVEHLRDAAVGPACTA